MTPRTIPVTMTEVDLQTGEETQHEVAFTLMPTAPGTCAMCGVDHPPEQPHNAQSLAYQYAFFADHQRWPTWADAMAHCTPEMQAFWREELAERGVDVGDGAVDALDRYAEDLTGHPDGELVMLEPDGAPPELVMFLLDAEVDPVRITFDGGGCASIHGDGQRYTMFSPEQLEYIAAKGREAVGVWERWAAEHPEEDPEAE